MKKAFVPVTERAIVQRINRRLKPDLLQLKKCRDGRWHDELGDYYLLDLNRNSIDEKHVDLATMAKELKVISDFEQVKND